MNAFGAFSAAYDVAPNHARATANLQGRCFEYLGSLYLLWKHGAQIRVRKLPLAMNKPGKRDGFALWTENVARLGMTARKKHRLVRKNQTKSLKDVVHLLFRDPGTAKALGSGHKVKYTSLE